MALERVSIGMALVALVVTLGFPSATAEEGPDLLKDPPATLPMYHRADELGWKEHPIRKGDGKGGWMYVPGEHQLLAGKFDAGLGIMPFGLVQMDNGDVILAASHNDGKKEIPVLAFSKDRGDTWSDWHTVPGTGGKPGDGRPMTLTYLGKGDLFFVIYNTSLKITQRRFSHDYGRTWPECVDVPGPAVTNEGNSLVDFDDEGNVKAVAEVVYNLRQDDGSDWNWTKPANSFFRWSYNGGRTWTPATRPEEWRWDETYEGKTYRRSVSEGALARAKNGALVAALRTDMPARYIARPKSDDGVEGTGVSISTDDGKTWSPLSERIVFEAGRHHANLVMLPTGDLVMTVIVRNDISDGALASYERGCEAVVSTDNGDTWDVAGKYVLDEFKYVKADKWSDVKSGHLSSVVLDDGSVLTAYGNYLAKAAMLIRWKPQ
ncbi:MAG: sialidase family protein [Planctomycetota bacterium]